MNLEGLDASPSPNKSGRPRPSKEARAAAQIGQACASAFLVS